MIACICEILACLIALTTISHSLEGFSGYEYLLWSAFHFCLELALETWAKATLNNSLGVHDLDDTLTTLSHQWVLNCQGLSTSKRSSWQKTAPKSGEEWYLHLFVLMCWARSFYSQPRLPPWHYVCPPTSPYPFLLVQNLFTERNAPIAAKVRWYQMVSVVVRFSLFIFSFLIMCCNVICKLLPGSSPFIFHFNS